MHPPIASARPPARILIGIDDSAAYQRQMLRGILAYRNRHRPGWEFLFNNRAEPLDVKLKLHRRVDGILLQQVAPSVLSPASARLLEKAAVPTVLIEEINDRYPMVLSDAAATGRMAFEHFAGKGFQNMAYLGEPGTWVYDRRGEAFRAAVRESGRDLIEAPPELTQLMRAPDRRKKALGPWLAGLPKPLGLFVGPIAPARETIAACRDGGIAVPDDVAVLGVGHDEVHCAMIDPPLSAIDQGMERAGYEAASLLHRMMNGEPAPPATEPILIPPVGVVERQSTNILAVEDPDVRAAVRWIRNHALDGGGVADMLRQVPVGRRRLEIAFRRHLGRTLHEEVLRVRLDRAKDLLVNSQMTMPQVAAHCGFNYASRLIEAFKRDTAMTPISYRRRFSRNGHGAGG